MAFLPSFLPSPKTHKTFFPFSPLLPSSLSDFHPDSCNSKSISMEMAQSNRMIAALFVSLCLLARSTRATDVQYCDKKADYSVKVKGVEISPDPVARGKTATFSISATADGAITGGKLVIDVSYFGWYIHSETHDLCEETSCPVTTGDFVVAHSQVLPGFTPPGSYSLKMKMYDADKNELTCISFNFNIGFASSVADS